MASPLPPAIDTNLSDLFCGEYCLAAYNVCLDLQQKVTAANDLMYVRILGYLILHAPFEIVRAEVARAILSFSHDERKLLTLGECFLLWYIAPFKRSKGPTPVPSSPSSFDWLKEDLKAPIKEAPKDHRQAQAQALIRDGYKCAVTGFYDYYIHGSDTMTAPEDAYFVYTRCGHILPESNCFNASSLGDKEEFARPVLTVLKWLGYDVEKVNGPKMHSLSNVITMQNDALDMFNDLEMWFESTELVGNHYRVQTTRRLPFQQPQAEVTFTSTDPEHLSPPSPQLLTLHATCAKVANLSGARKYIDKIDREAADLEVLELDGSSDDVLSHVLGRLTLSVDTAA